jgi:hypothetical protein
MKHPSVQISGFPPLHGTMPDVLEEINIYEVLFLTYRRGYGGDKKDTIL